MAEHDLTQRMIPYLDRHMALPLLGHLTDLEPPLFPAPSLLKAQYELVKKTNMVDYAQQLFSTAYPDKDDPAEFASRREEVAAKNTSLAAAAEEVLDVISKPEVAGQLKQDKDQNLIWLKDNYQLTPESILTLYHYGQFQYTYGDYAGASQYLYHFLVLSTDPDLNLSAHWGKLSSDILSGSWDEALKGVNEIKDLIDSRSGSAFAVNSRSMAEGGTQGSSAAAGQGGDLAQLQARSWLLHWSLFVYFNHPDGLPLLLELFLSPAYLSTLRTSCPHLLRYLVFAVIVTHRLPPSPRVPGQKRSDPLRDVVRAIEGEAYQYEDPLTQFITRLHTEFDFEGAQESLSTAEKVVANDFFLTSGDGKPELFLENARYLISETYCKIHQRVDINDLSARLNLTREEGEKWIVTLIRDTRLEGKIDLNANMLHITRPYASQPPSQSILTTTRDLAESAQTMGWAISQNNSAGRGGASGGRGGNRQGGGGGGGRGRKQEGEEAQAVEAK